MSSYSKDLLYILYIIKAQKKKLKKVGGRVEVDTAREPIAVHIFASCPPCNRSVLLLPHPCRPGGSPGAQYLRRARGRGSRPYLQKSLHQLQSWQTRERGEIYITSPPRPSLLESLSRSSRYSTVEVAGSATVLYCTVLYCTVIGFYTELKYSTVQYSHTVIGLFSLPGTVPYKTY